MSVYSPVYQYRMTVEYTHPDSGSENRFEREITEQLRGMGATSIQAVVMEVGH